MTEAWEYVPLIFAVAIAILVCAVVARSKRTSNEDGGRGQRVLVVVFGVTAIVVSLIIQFVPSGQRWLWVLAILPASFVLLHGTHLAVFKNRRFFEASQDPDYSAVEPSLVPILKAAQRQERQYYSTASITLRFALPAILLFTISLTVGYSLITPPSWGSYLADEKFLAGAQIGVVGAYVYILLFLGRRAMRSDITPAAVIWASVTIVGGPLFAGSLQVLFLGDPDKSWSKLLLPFAAGFSLQFISDVVEATIRRMFATQGNAGWRHIPLGQLRGMTRDSEDRLLEEGITDVAMLAMANPVRLRRNTRFDKRQITAWIDEALLITHFPNAWQSLENDGITGAIHLVWYSMSAAPPPNYSISPPQPAKPAAPTVTNTIPLEMTERIKHLADRNKLDHKALTEVILRMAQDAQVQMVRAFYQLDDTESTEDDWLFRGFRAENTEVPQTETTRAASTNGFEAFIPKDTVSEANDPNARRIQRQERYAQTHGLFIVHTWRRSTQRGQVADIIIRLAQHQEGPLTRGTVKSVAYDLGSKFSASPIVKTNAADAFSLSISAWGPVLCLAKVTFTDGTPPVDLERYIDFDTRGAAPT